MDNQTQIQITILNNKLNSIELRMNKIENSFKKIFDDLKDIKKRHFILSKVLKSIDDDVEYNEREK